MQTTSVKLYSLEYSEAKTYLAAALFLAGNIVLPQLFHTIRLGGPTWLPIYFFTLVGAYKYGWRAGLLTALASPVANALLFGMPAAAALPAIVLKSVLLAGAAGYAAARFRRASLALLAAVVLFYQAAGTLGEWALTGSFHAAVQDFRPLDDAERATVAEAVKIINDAIAIPCTACRYCVEGCPKHIAIPDYFALYNADRQSVNHLFSIQQTYYDNLAQTHGRASECIGCRKCERSCPQHLPIVDDLKRVAATFETAG